MFKYICRLTLSLSFIMLFFSACQLATKYKPAKSNEGFGYENHKLREDVYKVSFKGNSYTTRETVEESMIYRAAEITNQTGHTYFEILSKDTDVIKKMDVDYTSPVFANSYVTGYYGSGGYRYPYYSYGTPWSYGYNPEVGTKKNFEMVAFVRMYEKEPKRPSKNLQKATVVLEDLKDEIVTK